MGSSYQAKAQAFFTSRISVAAARANWTCVPGVGLFRVRGLPPAPGRPSDRANHSEAGERCREDSGALAHVLSEARTAGLAALLATKAVDSKNRSLGPVNKAFVDLDDVAQEGLFVTSAGEPARRTSPIEPSSRTLPPCRLPLSPDEPLDCFPFRAWSPGEPRSRSPRDDCVVLERRGGWAVTDCARRMAFVCELYPGVAGECNHDGKPEAGCNTLAGWRVGTPAEHLRPAVPALLGRPHRVLGSGIVPPSTTVILPEHLLHTFQSLALPGPPGTAQLDARPQG